MAILILLLVNNSYADRIETEIITYTNKVYFNGPVYILTNASFLGTITNGINVTTSNGQLRLLNGDYAPNVIAGHSGNAILNGASSATIIGGGGVGAPNVIAGIDSRYTLIAGGYDSTLNGIASSIIAAPHSSNTATHAMIAGGSTHKILAINGPNESDYAASIGGLQNVIYDSYNGIMLGTRFGIMSNANYSILLGGYSNTIMNANYALAAGYRALSSANGAFTFKDSRLDEFTNATENKFACSFSNGYEFGGVNGATIATFKRPYSSSSNSIILGAGGLITGDRSDIYILPTTAKSGIVLRHVTEDGGISNGLIVASDGNVFIGYSDRPVTSNRLDVQGNVVVSELIGIGTNTPLSALHIVKYLPIPNNLGAYSNYQIVVQGNSTTSNTAGILLATSGDQYGGSAIIHRDEDVGGMGSLQFYTKQTTGIGAPTEVMRLTSTGNVGIGTTNPLTRLHVEAVSGGTGVVTIAGNLESFTTVGQEFASLQFRSGDSSINNPNRISGRIVSVSEISNGSYAGLAFETFTQGGTPTNLTEKMRIAYNGNVGIGTTNPLYKLTVQDSNTNNELRANGNSLTLISGNTISPIFTVIGNGAADTVNIFDGGTEVFTILDGGNVGIGTNNPLSKLHIFGTSVTAPTYDDLILDTYVPGIQFRDASATTASDDFRIQSENGILYLQSDADEDWDYDTNILYITQAGLLGIQTIPSYTLDVNGTAKALTLRSGNIISGVKTQSLVLTSSSTLYSNALGEITFDASGTGKGEGLVFNIRSGGSAPTNKFYITDSSLYALANGPFIFDLVNKNFSIISSQITNVAPLLSVSGTYGNSTGTFEGVVFNITPTYSGVASKLFTIQTNAIPLFDVDKAGRLLLKGLNGHALWASKSPYLGTYPLINMSEVSTSDMYSVSGTYIGISATNGYVGDFVNYGINGASKYKVDYNGNVAVSNRVTAQEFSIGTIGTNFLYYLNTTNYVAMWANTNAYYIQCVTNGINGPVKTNTLW
jgi:hypothetical protein